MLTTNNLKDGLQNFANLVVSKAKENLVKKDKVSSGDLYNSINTTGVVLTEGSLEIGITMADYGGFIDKGVSGVEVKYNTPYSYKDKMPPPSALDGWIVKRGIAPRDDKGRFLSRTSIQFAIAKSIFKKGIAPSHFLTEAVEESMPLLPSDLSSKFALDVRSSVDFIIKTNKRK
jgi:hypothetical protein